MKKIIIFGTGMIAEVAHFYFTHDSEFEVAAFTVDEAHLTSPVFKGLPCVPFEKIEETFPPSDYGLFVALSYTRLNSLRTQKYEEAKQKKYKIVNYISSKATVWPKLDALENCFILEDNTIQPFVTLGNNVTLWSGNHIGHHSTIEDNCFISSHVVISGGVTVGKNCFIGVNSTLRNAISIGKNSVIGAGALIMNDVAESSVYMGDATPLSRVSSNRLKNI
jgi:sugar O-acyltransferase (sialic acid O-acetyltransferase NeuD family)